MIKLHSKGTAPDYTEHGSVTTDCRTVGEFMTEAAAIYGGNLTIKVDGCRYDLFDNPKLRVADDTQLEYVTYASAPGSMVFCIKTKPEPNTVKKSGWVNIYRAADDRAKRIVGTIYDTKSEANMLPKSASRIAVARIEWEEVQE